MAKGTAKKAPMKAAPAKKKATRKKATRKKATAKKATPKKATPKKATAKTAAPKKAKPIVARNLAEGLRAWIGRGGGELDDVFSNANDLQVSTKADVAALCEALDAFATQPVDKDGFSSPLNALVAYFQSVATKELFGDMVREALPRLRAIIGDVLDGKSAGRDSDVLFILKMFAGYKQEVDTQAIAEVARRGFDEDGFMWSIVFGMYDGDHPHAAALVDALRDPLPPGFIGIAFLDMCNQLAIAGKLAEHPFDTNAGLGRLAGFLRDPDPDHASYAHSATAALPFLKDRATLLAIAAQHPNIDVRIEAAWAAAKCGEEKALDRLVKWSMDPIHASKAQQYLEELGHASRIPPGTQEPKFQALAEMANWLAHPMELGKPPKAIEIYDTRELYWPPTKDWRSVALVKYTTDKDEVGIGMVGSVTFALFGRETGTLSPEDVYALHCCWELEKDLDIKSGRKLLAAKNQRF